MRENGIKQKNVAHFNNKLVANLLLDEPLSCIELSKKTKLTHVATGIIVDRLLNMDLIRFHREEPPKKRSQGGQHVRYEINPKRAYYICISFQYGRESFSIYDLSKNCVYSESFSDDMVDEAVFDGVIKRIKKVLVDRKISDDSVAVVSVAIPGRMDTESGEIIVSTRIDKALNLKEKLKKAFPFSVTEVKNDIDYACLGSILSEEFDYGNGTHFYLYVGWKGMACCIISDKKIICGANGFCGEVGMNYVDKERGRLSDVIPVEHMISDCGKILNDSSADLSDIVKQSYLNADIRKKFIENAAFFGAFISNYIDVLGCTHIVFAGPISAYPDYSFEVFKNNIIDPEYGAMMNYKVDISTVDATNIGQMLTSRLRALDWVMEKY